LGVYVFIFLFFLPFKHSLFLKMLTFDALNPMYQTKPKVRDWLIHSVQIPKEFALVLFQSGITGLDFKELVVNNGKALQALIYSGLSHSGGVSLEEGLHNVDISVKRIIRAMQLILLG
jgi:hypothetical protein